MNAGIVDTGNVLDDGQTKAGATGSFAAALIDPIEPFKNAGLRLFGNTDAVVFDGQGAVSISVASHDDLYFSAGSVVSDGVVAKILAQFVQKAAAS